MLTYGDYLIAPDKAGFIYNAIGAHMQSEEYKRADMAQSYYARDNRAIVKRLTWLEKMGIKANVRYFRMRDGFFQRMCRQTAGYLLGNGVTLEEPTKAKLGRDFDKDLYTAGLYALVDGVSWCFWNLEKMNVFRVTEFVPLWDEFSGKLMAGIRFWRLEDNRPLNIEFFGQDGITAYQESDGTLTIIGTQPYSYTRIVYNGLPDAIIPDNTPMLPVIPLYANELKVSEFNDGLKEDIDASDFIRSDLVDGITQIEGVYWIVKNYGGEDLRELAARLQEIKARHSDEDTRSDIKQETIAIPYEAKQVALDLLRNKMHSDTMTLDTRALTGGSLTNVAIKVAYSDFDLRTDLFEAETSKLVRNILQLMGIDEEPKFKRRTLINDSEMVSNISTMLADGYIDDEMAIRKNPLIDDDEQEELMNRIALERQEDINEVFPLEVNNGQSAEGNTGGTQ